MPDGPTNGCTGACFTCRHWDETTRLCGIYAERPLMCRGFPYGKPCAFGCDHEGTPMEELIAQEKAGGEPE